MNIASETLTASTDKGFSYARRFCLVSAASITVLLFYLGTQPFAIGLFPAPWDKLAHLLVFGTITGLLWIGSAGQMPLLLIIIVAAIGALDEWHQSGLPGRSMDVTDLITDISAALLTVIVLQTRSNNQDEADNTGPTSFHH